jgi:polar amino acid transport system substrate-binding protein
MKFVVLCGLCFFFSSPRLHARSFEQIKKNGTLIVATNGTFAPFSYYEKLTLTGFEIDLIEAMAKELGVKTEWKVVPFENTLIGLSQDRYDLVIASHGITPDRQKIVDFSDPYYCSSAVIMSRTGGPITKDDLLGKTLGAQVGTTYLSYLQAIKGVGEIKTFKSETDTFMALSSGRVAAMIGDKFAALVAIKARPEIKLQVGETLFQEHISMAIKKGNQSLLTAINGALKKLQIGETYKEISEKYFSEDIRCK